MFCEHATRMRAQSTCWGSLTWNVCEFPPDPFWSSLLWLWWTLQSAWEKAKDIPRAWVWLLFFHRVILHISYLLLKLGYLLHVYALYTVLLCQVSLLFFQLLNLFQKHCLVTQRAQISWDSILSYLITAVILNNNICIGCGAIRTEHCALSCTSWMESQYFT